MIPKIIHYCWFGGKPLPELAVRCIESWKHFLPDYEIREWNESNFDVNEIPYVRDAYQAKRYAFVSDYARFWILYKYGGLYFDTDVEIIKPLDEILARGQFMGSEDDEELAVAPGLGLGFEAGNELVRRIMDSYNDRDFFQKDGNTTTVVTYVSDILAERGVKPSSAIQECEGIYIYPKEYFCPKDFKTGKLTITPRTVTIHHYDGTWLTEDVLYMRKLAKKLGSRKLGFFIAEVIMRVKYHGLKVGLKYCWERISIRL